LLYYNLKFFADRILKYENTSYEFIITDIKLKEERFENRIKQF